MNELVARYIPGARVAIEHVRSPVGDVVVVLLRCGCRALLDYESMLIACTSNANGLSGAFRRLAGHECRPALLPDPSIASTLQTPAALPPQTPTEE